MSGFSDSRRLIAALSACVVVAAVGGVVGDAIAGVIVIAVMVPAIRAVRKLRGSTAWRQIAGGGLVLGLAPVVSVPIAEYWTVGDLLAFGGYTAFIVGLERAIRVRTQRLQADVALDATLVVAWLFCFLNILVVKDLAESLHGRELTAALSYAPFTLLLLLQLLRLGLGSPDYSKAFVYLSLAMVAAAGSELLFLIDADASHGWARSYAVGLASAGLVFISAAVSHDSASDFERPSRGEFRSIDAVRGTFHVSSIAVLVIMALTRSDHAPVVMLSLLGLAALLSVRIYMVVKERERWIESERKMQLLASAFLDAEDERQVVGLAVEAVEGLIANRMFASVEVLREVAGEWLLDESDRDGSGDDGSVRGIESSDLRIAASLGSSQYSEYSSGRSARNVSRLVVPLSLADCARALLVVEAMPVLVPLQVSLIESVASTVRLSLEALSAREVAHQQRAHHRFRALSQDSNDVVALVKNGSSVVDLVGPTLERLLGRGEAELLGRDPLVFVEPSDAERIQAQIDIAGSGVVSVEPVDVRLMHSDGRHHWFSASVRDLRLDPEVQGLVYSFRDVNDRKMAELQVRTSEGRYRSLIQNSNDIFAVVDRDNRLTYVSPNVERLLGFSPSDLIGTDARGLLTSNGSQTLESAAAGWHGHLVDEELLLELRTATSELRMARVRFTEMRQDDENSILITVHDVTEQLLLEESLRNQALYDPLTGVLNRSSVIPEIQRALQELRAVDCLAVLHLDVIDFSEINSSVGFSEGDNVLIEVASRVRSVLRADDVLARLDGDEFVVLARASGEGEAAYDLALKVLSVFDEPFAIGGRMITLHAGLGMVRTSDRRENPTALLENAGLAGRHGRANDERLMLFDDSMRAAAAERFELAADLRANIDSDQFSIVYQPLFDLKANQVTSVEALMRWHHPTRGHISPGVFIPLAESTGSIIDLGRMVMRRACRQLALWQTSLPGGENLSVAVNVSARQLELPDEVKALHDIIAEAGIPTSKLTIELTESTFIEDAVWLRAQLESFRALGIRIAVDDFGAGSAGLAHLRDMPFDILKIDKAYIDHLEYSSEALSLVSGVVDLAHNLNARLVAEGIETPGQMALLREMGCDYGQGFFLGRPMTADALEHWIGQGWAGEAAAVILTKERQRVF